MRVSFTKMTGAGNDFVVIDNRENFFAKRADLARRLCDRHWGVGGDGLLLLENAEGAAYRMEYYNADGSHGGMCGNGGRCIAAFAVERQIAPPVHSFEALGDKYTASVAGEDVSLEMKDPRDIRLNVTLTVQGVNHAVHYVDTGAPHVVLIVEDVDAIGEVVPLGRAIRAHEVFRPSGTNVNFVQVTGSHALRIRTYERGVEDETLACGTGSVAAAVIGTLVLGLDRPIDVQVRSGARLRVDFDRTSESGIRRVVLRGPVKTVFRGEIDLQDVV